MSYRIRLLPNELNPRVCERSEKQRLTRCNCNNVSKFRDVGFAWVESIIRDLGFKLKIDIVRLLVIHPLKSMKKAQGFSHCERLN